MIGRRTFLGAIAGAVCTASLPAEAQQASKVPRIGVLQANRNENVAAFAQGLRDAGYIDGQNAVVELRIWEGMLDRLSPLAEELVGLKCDVILAASAYSIRAVRNATSTIPIVGIDLESDPVASGWAGSLGRPGGNFTGLFLDLPELGGKLLELLKGAVPRVTRVAALWDSAVGEVQFRATEAAARAAGVSVESLSIRQLGDFKGAIERASRQRVSGIIVLSSPLILRERAQIADLALKNRLPTISLFTLFPGSGGLMAYGPDLPEMFRRSAAYVDRILKGAKVGDLPIERPSSFQFIINIRTAKALKLTIPQSLLVRADQLVE